MPRSRFSRAAAAAAFTLALGGTVVGCSVNPATGERQLILVSEEQEIAMGREAHEQILAQMGVYPEDDVQAYVSRLGQELAAESERPDLPWTFTVIDDPTVNAFALPGGFIYVTRGIMTHLNTEAELVSVLGHEIGHVTGRHGVERLSKAQLYGLGLGIGMILSPELAQFGDLAQQGLGLLFLKYSRDDEREADDLGLRYTVRGGWDPREMPGVFQVLQAVGEASGSGRIPGWLSTHPDPGRRSQTIGEAVAAMDTDFGSFQVNRDPYMRQLDGMIFGPNPREGFFRDSAFYHPDLAFRLDFPGGWKTQNQKQAVLGVSPNEDAAVVLTLAPEADPSAAARAFLSQQGIQGGRIETGRIHGFPAATAAFEVPQQQNSLAGRVAFVRYGDNTYRLLGYTLRERFGSYARAFDGFIGSFDRVTDRSILDVQPARVSLVRPNRDLSVQAFHGEFPSSVPVETVALINHVAPTGTLPGGLAAKRVVGGIQ